MPQSKPAGVRCVQLDAQTRCRIFGQPGRPAVCSGLRPSADMCGGSTHEALQYLARLERLTQPGAALSQPSPPRLAGMSPAARPGVL